MLFTGKPGKIWDGSKGKALCRFDATGLLNTKDSYIIEELLKKGFTEATSRNLINVDVCNGIHVDWKDKYEAEHQALMALRGKYREIELQLKDIEENTQMKVAPVPVEVAEKEAVKEISDNYILGDDVMQKDYENIPSPKLKSILKNHDGLQGKDYRKVTKVEAVIMMAQLLEREGLTK